MASIMIFLIPASFLIVMLPSIEGIAGTSPCNSTIKFTKTVNEFSIESPNFPIGSYPHGTICIWRVEGLQFHSVSLNIKEVRMKGQVTPHCSHSDRLVFQAAEGTTITKVCDRGSRLRKSITNQHFVITFKSEPRARLFGNPLVYGFHILLTATPNYDLKCQPNGFQLSLPKSELPSPSKSSYESYRLTHATCTAKVERKQLVLQTTYQDCGTTFISGVGYFNTLSRVLPSDPSRIERFAIHCTNLGERFVVSTQYNPDQGQNTSSEPRQFAVQRSLGTFSASTHTFTNVIEGSLIDTKLITRFFGPRVEISVVGHLPKDSKIATKSCWITRSPHSYYQRKLFILENGCTKPAHQVVRVAHSPPYLDRFAFRTLKLQNRTANSHFLHCEINVCSLNDSLEKAECSRTCIPPEITTTTARTTTLTSSPSTISSTIVLAESSEMINLTTLMPATNGLESSTPEEMVTTPDSFEYGRMRGIVRDAVRNDELSTVRIVAKSGDLTVGSTETLHNGTYTLDLPQNVDYTIHFQSAGYHPLTMRNVRLAKNEDKTLETILYIEDKFVGSGHASGIIKNALTGFVETGVLIELRSGLNTQTGHVIEKVTSRSDGSWGAELETGYYTAQLSKKGFVNTSMSVTVLGGITRGNHNPSIAPILQSGVTLIKLTWGEHPLDLDSHLSGPASTGRFHVFYQQMGAELSSPYSMLDTDDVNSFGPETITIRKQFAGQYQYSVHDFTNRLVGATMKLAESSAKVEVSRGNAIVAVYHVPQTEGTLWTVFQLEGEELVQINKMSYQSRPSDVE